MKRRLAVAALLVAGGCGNTPTATPQHTPFSDGPKHNVPRSQETPESYIVELPRPTRTRAARSRTRPTPTAPAVGDGDFWRRLAMCESGMRETHNQYVGYFQFSRDTARKVGIDGSEDYETQKAAAQRWASLVDPGSRSGWPVCWWEAAA